MSRLVLAVIGAIIAGLTCWGVFGALAAIWFSSLPGGQREGGGAMAGLFFVGPIFGCLGLAVGGWLVWGLLQDPERTGRVMLGMGAVLVTLVAGAAIALRPAVIMPDDFPNQTAELLVEVSFPAEQIERLSKADVLQLELRAGDGTETTPALREQTRRDGSRAIIPGKFPTRVRPRTKLLAVMKNGEQVMCSTLSIEDQPERTTDWAAWQPMEAGLEARWRLDVRNKSGH